MEDQVVEKDLLILQIQLDLMLELVLPVKVTTEVMVMIGSRQEVVLDNGLWEAAEAPVK